MATQNAIGSSKPIEVTFGGTGAATLTDNAILLGSGTGAITAAAVGATGEILIGTTGADASWSATPTVTSLTATTVYGTTFDTNDAAKGVTLTLATLAADGTDADIDILITPKGTGKVKIPDLELTTDLAVTEGGTGVSTLTDHGVLLGSGAGAVSVSAVGSTGTILTGVTGADPAWTTATYPATAAIGTILIASGANTITTLAPDTAGYVLTDGGAGVAPSWSATGAGTVTSVSGGTNITDSGTATDPIMDLDAAITLTSITASNVYGDTIDTNVASARIEISGTGIATAGTDANIDLGITAQGTGQVVIDDLQLTTDLAVSEGGTGASTLTDGGVLVGSGTGAITPLTVGTSGSVLLGSTGADPVFADLTSTGGTVTFTKGAGTLNLESSASSNLTLNAQTGTTYTLVLTDAGKLVTLDNAAAIALTIPPNSSVAFGIGTQILLEAKGAGTVTVGPGAGVTLQSRGSVYDSAGQYAVLSLLKVASDIWVLSGDIS